MTDYEIVFACVCVSTRLSVCLSTLERFHLLISVIFVNENENENGEKGENNEFVNEN